VESVHWAANEEMPLQVDGPEFLIANLVEQPEKRRRLVHFVNYNSKRVSQIRNIDVTCFLPEGQHASAVKMYSASSPDGEALKFRFESSKAVFRVPVLSTYCIIAIGW